MTRDYELYIEEHNIEVTIDCHCILGNDGIGSYEYAGARGYDAGTNYLIVEDMTWDRSGFTEEQNSIIQEHINRNYEEIADEVVNKIKPSDFY